MSYRRLASRPIAAHSRADALQTPIPLPDRNNVLLRCVINEIFSLHAVSTTGAQRQSRKWRLE